MSENESEEQERQGAQGLPHGWMPFHEKQVMLQLREPYIGCTYAHGPSLDESGGARAVPVLSGTLHVAPDGNGGTMLVLSTPTGNGSDVALIALTPADVVYATHIHQSRIIQQ